MVLTCPLCKRPIEVLDAVQARRSMEEGKVIREPTFVFHFERRAVECRGSRKTVDEAARIAFPKGPDVAH